MSLKIASSRDLRHHSLITSNGDGRGMSAEIRKTTRNVPTIPAGACHVLLSVKSIDNLLTR